MYNPETMTTLGTLDTYNKYQRKWKGQSSMYNPETMTTVGTLDTV
jgi:hypothetical protein